jgi:hypothetical protein
MDEPEKSFGDCPVEGCSNRLAKPEDLVCPGDFTALAGTCRGKKPLGQPEADWIQGRGRGVAYRCELCRQYHNGNSAARNVAIMKATLRAVIRAMRADPRCGSEGLLNLIDAWAPTRVKRESWCENLDQREAYAVP